jgi:hypothetical protein
MIVMKFDTWEEWDNAIAGIASAFIAEETDECAECGHDVVKSQQADHACSVWLGY